jgi:hypothetical protein
MWTASIISFRQQIHNPQKIKKRIKQISRIKTPHSGDQYEWSNKTETFRNAVRSQVIKTTYTKFSIKTHYPVSIYPYWAHTPKKLSPANHNI